MQPLAPHPRPSPPPPRSLGSFTGDRGGGETRGLARAVPGAAGLALTSALLISLTLGACGRSAPPREAPAPRVVSLVPAATATLRQLDREAHLVGVTRYCDAPGVPVVGDMAPPPERILAQEPDLVLVGDYPSQARIRGQLEALGIEVVVLPYVRIGDMIHATRLLGRRLDAAPRAEELASAVEAALGRAAAGHRSPQPVTVLIVYDTEAGHVFTTGGGDHVAEVIEAVGAQNIAAGGPLTTRLGLEVVLARAPEVVLHVAPSPRFPDHAAALRHWAAALPDLPAVKAGRVHVWPDDRLAQNGPWLAGAIDELMTLLHGPPPASAGTP